MDRTLKVYSSTQHLFAEITFHYDQPRQATAHYTQYRPLNPEAEEDESKSVYPLTERELYLQFRQFDSVDQIKTHDKELVKKELGRDMDDPKGYTYVYDSTPVLLRYVVGNERQHHGLVNVLFSFADNTKEVKFLSAHHPRFDVDLSADSLETNLSCILRIPLYIDRDVREISPHDLRRLEPWY